MFDGIITISYNFWEYSTEQSPKSPWLNFFFLDNVSYIERRGVMVTDSKTNFNNFTIFKF